MSDRPDPKPDGGTNSGDDLTRIAQAPPSASPSASSPPETDDSTRLSDRPLPLLSPQGPLADRMVEAGVLINNNYRIQRILSAGGMGEVYQAENVFTGDPVAVKIVLPSLASDDGIIQLFKREARILGQLNDSAIVRYHNFVLDQGLGRYCLIMEYIDGRTLWDEVDSNGPIPADAALHLIRRLSHGLAKAHARGVTHRDLSPDNVMLRGNRIRDAVLIDFGIARAVDFGEGTLAGRFAGKFKYVSPEQLGHYGGEIGPAADIYGMALMMAAVLRGKALDMGASATEAVEARRGIPDLTGLPHEVYPLLQYMLEPDPRDRPGSMKDVAQMSGDPTRIPLRYRMPLWGAHAGSVSAHGRETGSAGRSDKLMQPAAPGRSKRSPRPTSPWLPLIGSLAAVLVVGGWVLLRGDQTPPPDPGATGGEATVADDEMILPPRDLTTREGFLAQFDLGACAQVQRIASGLDAGKLSAVSDRPLDTAALIGAYDGAFGTRPEVIASRIDPAQCAAVDFVRALQGRAEPPPVLSLDATSLPVGGAVAGRVRETQGRSLWLFLVAADGGVHDLSSRLVPQTDGSFTFSFGLALRDLAATSPQLIVALASRSPLVAPVTAAAGAPVAVILPEVQTEIAAGGGFAAADLAHFDLTPADGETPPAN